MFTRAGGVEAIVSLGQRAADLVSKVASSSPDKGTDDEAAGAYAYGLLNVVVHLLGVLVAARPLLESSQTVPLVTRDKDVRHPEYFEPHAFIVRMRHRVLPFLRELWQSTWLVNAPLPVVKSILGAIVEIMAADHEEAPSETIPDATLPSIQQLQAQLRPNNTPDEAAITQLVDMGFSRSSAERALMRSRNNVNAAAELLLSHPHLFPAIPPVTADAAPAPPQEVNPPPAPEAAPEAAPATNAPEDAGPATPPADVKTAFVRLGKSQQERGLLSVLQVDANATSEILAARCRLLALILNDPAFPILQVSSSELQEVMDSVMTTLRRLPDPEKLSTATIPAWLAPYLLVAEALISLGDSITEVEVPTPEQDVPTIELHSGARFVDERKFVFDLCLGLLKLHDLPRDEMLAVLRLLALLTKEYSIGAAFVDRAGPNLLLDHFKGSNKDALTYRSLGFTIIRHATEDASIVEGLMKHHLKRFFALSRNRLTDVGSMVKSTSPLALRDPATYVSACKTTCRLATLRPGSSTYTISLDADNKQPESQEKTDAMQVDASSKADPKLAEVIIHYVMSELLKVGKAPTPAQPSGGTEPLPAASQLPAKEGGASSSGQVEGSKPYEETGEYAYTCILMQLLAELLSSYDSCKVAFVSFHKRRSSGLREGTSKGRPAFLGFLLNEILAAHAGLPKEDPLKKPSLSSWATSIIVALCSDIYTTGNVKDASDELTAARKFVLDALAKAMKEVSSGETPDVRYGRLYGLAELCYRLLSFRSPSPSGGKEETNIHIAKIMLEKNFVATLTAALADADLNYPGMKSLISAIMRPLEHLYVVKDMEDVEFGEDDVEDMDEDDEDEDDAEMDYGDDDSSGTEPSTEDEEEVVDGMDVGMEDANANDWDEGEDHDESGEEDDEEDEIVEAVTDIVWQPNGDEAGGEDAMNAPQIEEGDEEAINDGDEGSLVSADEQGEDDVPSEEEIVLEFADGVGDDEVALVGGAWTGIAAPDLGGHRHTHSLVPPRRGRPIAVEDPYAYLGPSRRTAPLIDPTSHPLLVEPTENPQQEGTATSRHAYRRVPHGGVIASGGSYLDLLQTISQVMGGEGAQILHDLIAHGRGAAGGLQQDIVQEAGAILTTLERGLMLHHHHHSPSRGDRRSRTQSIDPAQFTPQGTLQRWAEELKLLNPSLVGDRLTKLTGHVAISLLPAAKAADQAAKEEMARVEAERKREEEAKRVEEAKREEERQRELREEEERQAAALDITDTGIDVEFLEALPDDMREEIINQHFREHRSTTQPERPEESQISPEFLDALPPDIRAEILQQEMADRTRRERAAAAAQAAQQGGPSDIDAADFLASLDPALRQTVLMEQDEGFLQTLPSALLAEVNTNPMATMRRHLGRPTGTSSAPPAPALVKKAPSPRDAVQLLDKSGVSALVRLLFAPQAHKRSSIHKVLVNLCENSKTRVELLNILLTVLQNGTADLSAVDKGFSQMSVRAGRAQTPKTTPKKSVPDTNLSFIGPTGEGIPNLAAQRCLEALISLVNANELCSLFFLSEQELPAGLKRNLGKKGKGKEKVAPQTHYPIVLLLGLLDKPVILKAPSLMDLVAGLLASVTRPLTTAKEDTVSPSAPAEQEQATETAESGRTQEAGTEVGPSATSPEVPTATEAIPKAAPESQKPVTAQPQIPHSVLRLIVNILTVGECSARTFQQTLSLIQHLSFLPDARDTIASELRSKAQELGSVIYSELEELQRALDTAPSGDSVPSAVITKFSPASSDQAKLLRVLKTIDYMYTSKAFSTAGSTATPDPKAVSEDQEKAQAIYQTFRFNSLWNKLGDCLTLVSEKSDSDHIATVLLPLIESLMVVCKYVSGVGLKARAMREPMSPRSPTTPRESTEDLFVAFTDAHRKILNSMVRNNPSLMSGSFSLLVNNPRVLDFDNKRNYFTQKLRRRPANREQYGTLQVNVRRQRVFEDSFQHLQRQTGDQIKYGKLSVRFYDEEGVDAGGVTREWFQILARQMFNPDYALFQPCAADRLTYQPNQASWVNSEHLSFFKFVGRIIGKAIFDGRLLDAYFARSLYRQMLGKPVDYRDVEWVDPEYYKSLVWILENDPTILDLTFSVESNAFGLTKVVPLKEGGQIIPVTNENKREYVQLSAEYRLVLSIKEQIEAFLSGFYDIIPKDLIAIFNEQELELLISGTPDIDVDEWRAATDYHGYTSADPVIVWWWRALKSFNRDERAKVLSFATGTSKVPLGGFTELQGVQGVQRFSIHKAYGDVDRLPQAHTCFNQIDLPQYTSYEKLRTQLLLAINEGGEGFGFA
ncbi:hypothetical protein FRC00_009987 [Tulasnella sp. 408]|nr:hypothetical protein FRC00_009987 [Tulasnella sp. 408]